jgi:capsid protein
MKSWQSLTKTQKGRVINAFKRALNIGGYFSRGRYTVVTDDLTDPRHTRVTPETRGEEAALTASEYYRMVALARHEDRNTNAMASMLRQMEQNCIGCKGGKASFAFGFDNADTAKAMREKFASWAQDCEYFDEVNFAELLRLALRTRLITGRAVLLFDDLLIKDSGRILIFDGDSIANVSDAEFYKRFPAGWTQNRGIIKDEFGCTRGAIVSSSQRGKSEFDVIDSKGRPAVFFLYRAENERRLDAPFTIYQSRKRANQYVCAPEFAASLSSIADLEDITKYELAAAKKHSQTIATIEQERDTSPVLTDGLDVPVISDGSTAEETQEALEAAELSSGDMPLDISGIEKATGVFYEVLPPGLKMQLLDTKHPNPNMSEFIRWIEGRAGWAQGLASVYASGKADSSYSASRAEQVLTWPMFEAEQHKLETEICDWALRQWYKWALRKGHLNGITPPENWERKVKWGWPKMREIDAKSEQEVITAALRNGTMDLEEAYGPDWDEKLVKISELDMGYVNSNGTTLSTSQLTDEQHRKMADYYDFIVTKYFEIVPPAQQYGITQWCPTDAPGALGTGWRGGEPVGLFDQNYNRKYAYAGFANGLMRNK